MMIYSRSMPFAPLTLFILLGCQWSCSAPVQSPRGDVALLQASSVAMTAYNQGDLAQARTLFQRSLIRAHAIDSPLGIADAAYNLATCEFELANYRAADQLLDEAVYDAARVNAAAGDILLLKAKCAEAEGHFPQAIALAEQVLNSKPILPVQLGAMIVRGQGLCDGGRLADAKEQARAVARLAHGGKGMSWPSVAADEARLNGQIAQVEGRWAEAAKAFDVEVDQLRRAGRYRGLPPALARVAAAFSMARQPALAADRYFLAGRSAAAWGDSKSARQWLASSVSAAQTAGDAATGLRAQSLLREINEAADPGADTLQLPPVP